MSENQYIDAIHARRIDGVRSGEFTPNKRDANTMENINHIGDLLRNGTTIDQAKKLYPSWDVDWLATMAKRAGIA